MAIRGKSSKITKDGRQSRLKDMLESPVFNNPWSAGDTNEFKERSETILGGDAEKFAATQRVVYGLSVRTSNGRHAGAAASSAPPFFVIKTLKVSTIQSKKVVHDRQLRLEEIMKTHARLPRRRRPHSPSGYKVEITFEDKTPLSPTDLRRHRDVHHPGLLLHWPRGSTVKLSSAPAPSPLTAKPPASAESRCKICGATKKATRHVPMRHQGSSRHIIVSDGTDLLINTSQLETSDQALRSPPSKDKPAEVHQRSMTSTRSQPY
jgi:hypothetical protein